MRATGAGLALVIALAGARGSGAAPPAGLSFRYELQPGEHLIYRESLERKLRSERLEISSRATFETHVLVAFPAPGGWAVGFQRNRIGSELLRYRVEGHDRLEEGRRELAADLERRGPSFVEANRITPEGVALLPWSAVREATSERLPFFHEIEPLPPVVPGPGVSFTSPGVLGLHMRVVDSEEVAGEPCLRLEAEAGAGLTVRQWHCEGTSTLGRLEYDARYPSPGGVAVEETFRLERIALRRGEAAVEWLREPSTAAGVLAALALSEGPSLPASEVHRVLEGASDETARWALAVLWRLHLPAPPLETLRRLSTSGSPRVRALAVRLLGTRPEPEAAALREQRRADPDEAVRRAASPRPEASAAEVALARAVRGDGPLPEVTAPLDPGWGRSVLAAQRAPGQIAGTTLRFMREPRFRGRPFVLHVPEDYRGDEPYPLVVVLGGGPGRALPTAQTAESTVAPRGELVAYPEANGMWWDEEPARAVAALRHELLRELNVDTDRVTLTGFSNGGTGAILYASREPHRYAAVASLMGGGLPFYAATNPIDPAALARIPFLFVHGDEDPIIPASASRDTVKALRKANPSAIAELQVLAGRRHDIVYGREEGLALPFLSAHSRDPFPERVFLRARSTEWARAFWVEVLEKEGGMAEVDAVREAGTITLRTRRVKRLRLLLRREIVDPAVPLVVRLDGRQAFAGPTGEDVPLLLRSWRETGDPLLAHSVEITLDVRR